MSLLFDKAGQREALRKRIELPWDSEDGGVGRSERHFGRDDTSAWSGRATESYLGGRREIGKSVGMGHSTENLDQGPNPWDVAVRELPGFAHFACV